MTPKNKKGELPWYRNTNYQGKMPESHKRVLDQLRMQSKHPAATFDDLPEETQGYISRLEGELYDIKQQQLALGTLACFMLGIYFLYQWYQSGEIAKLVGGLFFSFVSWPYYNFRWKKNAAQFMPEDNPNQACNEAMQEEWDINYLSNIRRSQES